MRFTYERPADRVARLSDGGCVRLRMVAQQELGVARRAWP
jgi:hypothetical protein